MKKEQFKYLITIIVTFFVGVGCTMYASKYYFKTDDTVKTSKNVTIQETNSIKEAISKVYDAVVFIENNDKSGGTSTGTGFIYKKDDKNAYILTNHHVVENYEKIMITTNNADTVEAKFLGSDEITDIAVLSIDSKYAMQVAEIGNSSDSNIGDTLFTVGSPLGREYMGTVTKGILSGKDRQVSTGQYVNDVLQTDAAINPGNSGGPLVNINGEVIAITSMKLVKDTIEGMGFALPIEIAMSYVDRLEQGKAIERPILGIQTIDIDSARYLYRYQLNISDDIEAGVVILDVEDGSSAEKAGLKKGDIITKINDNNVDDGAHFRYNLYKYSIGDTITITYIRNNKENNVKIKLTNSLN